MKTINEVSVKNYITRCLMLIAFTFFQCETQPSKSENTIHQNTEIAKPEIKPWPILFDSEREQLSLEYMKTRHGIDADTALIEPSMIVVHWTAIPDLEKSFNTFYPVKLAAFRTEISSASVLNVSAHFLIDRDGTTYQLLPETTFARHVIGLNHCAIGIENVGDGEAHPLTEAQFEANKKLIAHLIRKYDIEYLIGHDQYQNFIGHELWKETDPEYLTEKTDVGEEFINRLHEELNIPALKKAPEKED